MTENENAYGVYGQLPPSTPTPNTNLIPNNKYLPKNYNPVAYVTVPQNNIDDDNNNNNNNHRYNSGSSDDHYYRGDNTYDNNDNNNNEYYISSNTYDHYYRGDSTYDNNDNHNNNQYYQYQNGDRAGSKVRPLKSKSKSSIFLIVVFPHSISFFNFKLNFFRN